VQTCADGFLSSCLLEVIILQCNIGLTVYLFLLIDLRLEAIPHGAAIDLARLAQRSALHDSSPTTSTGICLQSIGSAATACRSLHRVDRDLVPIRQGWSGRTTGTPYSLSCIEHVSLWLGNFLDSSLTWTSIDRLFDCLGYCGQLSMGAVSCCIVLQGRTRLNTLLDLSCLTGDLTLPLPAVARLLLLHLWESVSQSWVVHLILGAVLYSIVLIGREVSLVLLVLWVLTHLGWIALDHRWLLPLLGWIEQGWLWSFD
jgi:hypothetical protein